MQEDRKGKVAWLGAIRRKPTREKWLNRVSSRWRVLTLIRKGKNGLPDPGPELRLATGWNMKKTCEDNTWNKNKKYIRLYGKGECKMLHYDYWWLILCYESCTPQIFVMTDLRRTDTTESRGRLYAPRVKRSSPLCRCSRYEVSKESRV